MTWSSCLNIFEACIETDTDGRDIRLRSVGGEDVDVLPRPDFSGLK